MTTDNALKSCKTRGNYLNTNFGEHPDFAAGSAFPYALP